MGQHEPIRFKTSAVVLGVWLLFNGASLTQANSAKVEELSLQSAITQALTPGPGLASLNARAKAKAAMAIQSGSLPDPRLSLNAVNLPVGNFSLDQEAMTQIQFGLSQDFPFPGKLALKEQADKDEAESSAGEVDEYRLTLIRDVKILWWQIFFLDHSLQTVSQNKNLIAQLIATAQTKYAVGKGLQQDVLLAELELSRLKEMELNLTDGRQNAVIRLNAILSRDIQTPVVLPKITDTRLAKPKSLVDLRQMAFEHRPLLLSSRAKTSAADSRLRLARKELYPDFRLGAIYGQRSGRDDLASVQLSMSLPIYAGSKQFQMKDQRQSELLASRFQLEDIQFRVAAEIGSSLSRYQQAAKQITLFEENIIPQAQQTIESMLSAYQVSSVDFLNVIRSQTTLFDYQTRYWGAFSNAQQALASLEAAVGQENIYE